MDSAPGDSSNRFAGLAAGYDRYRPDYPAAAIDYLMSHCDLGPGDFVVDVGCGTGISTRLVAGRGLRVIGIEPNADMRRIAEAVGSGAEYRGGRAEATGLPDASTKSILAAQAFHWFANDSALREFRRVLLPGGWVVLMWNEFDRNDRFTAAYVAAMVRWSPEPAIAGQIQSAHGEVLMKSELFERQERVEFPHQQALDREALLGRAFSASYAPRQEPERTQLEEELTAVFETHQQAGRVAMRYRTVVYTARRRGPV
jgi:ubiquinone/menaquinone biosynthesis C-methylase UbiE